MMSDLLVIIPAYNEAANIERVVSHLTESFPQYDYIVINDGSRDKTAEICRRNQFHLLDLPVNLGLSGVFQAGIRYACEKGYSSVIQFDGDGQHRPEFIGRMKKKLDEGYDIVIGSRFVNAKKSASLRMLGSRMLSLAIRITTGAVIHDPTSGMRMFNRKMIGGGGAGFDGRAVGRKELPDSGYGGPLYDPDAGVDFVYPEFQKEGQVDDDASARGADRGLRGDDLDDPAKDQDL